MARLPQPGSDANVWGDVLNTFLLQAHNGDGSLKPIPATNVTGMDDQLAGTFVKNGGANPVTILPISQAAYAALSSKDPNTLYIVL